MLLLDHFYEPSNQLQVWWRIDASLMQTQSRDFQGNVQKIILNFCFQNEILSDDWKSNRRRLCLMKVKQVLLFRYMVDSNTRKTKKIRKVFDFVYRIENENCKTKLESTCDSIFRSTQTIAVSHLVIVKNLIDFNDFSRKNVNHDLLMTESNLNQKHGSKWKKSGNSLRYRRST